MPEYDAVIVGAGPNGLAAAIEMARAGWSVMVYEANPTIGGGVRSAELTLPGFVHDICSAIHPLGVASPFMRSLPLQDYGLEWIQPEVHVAHPLDDGTAALLETSLEATGDTLGRDARAYRNLFGYLVKHWEQLMPDILAPLRWPQHPFLLTRFGLAALPPAQLLVKTLFRERYAQALFGGMAAHSFLPLHQVITSSFGLALGLLGHAVGWPVAKGGSQQIVNAMAAYLTSLNGKIEINRRIKSIDELPSARAVLFDVTPRQLLRIAGHKFPDGYRRALERYRYGPGIFKVDWALREAMPWTAPECRRAGTVHVGGTFAEIAVSERDANRGKVSERPFVLVGQQSLIDPSRAPHGQHTGWAYCHVPSGSTVDMTERIEQQIERFAPGFRDIILARATHHTGQFEAYNANYVGGDINGGLQNIWQLYTRPAWRVTPYSTPTKGIYLCSSSTPPGGGVHGMCGYHAARAALRDTIPTALRS